MNLTAKQQLSRNPSNAGYSTPLKTYSIPASENDDKTISVPAQPVFLIDPTVEPIPMGGNLVLRTRDNGQRTALPLTVGIGATGNGVTVPANVIWKVEALVADVICTATVGNRIIIGRIGNIFWVGPSSAATTAGQTCGYDVGFGNAGAPSTTVRRNLANTGNTNVQVIAQCPIETLGAGDTVTIQDTAAIDAADSISYRIWYREYPV